MKLLLLLILFFYIYKKSEGFKYKQILSANYGVEFDEFTKPSFVTDDHPDNRIANINKAKFRYTQKI